MENRALRLREVATAMQQYQDDVSSGASTARQWAPAANAGIRLAGGGIGGIGGSGADDPGGNVILIGSIKDFERNAVHGLKLNGIAAMEETSQGNSAAGTAGGPRAVGRLAMGSIGGRAASGGGEVEYFDEAGYIRRGALRSGEDPYIRNRFNQEASDALPSNREIPDTRSPM